MNIVDKIVASMDTSISGLARDLGLRRQNVQGWKSNGIPPKYCPQLEQMTGGKITRKEMRPEDWKCFWPELGE
jgi:DNA-binding transcriptional regulator YdaS (Cro superfamily)